MPVINNENENEPGFNFNIKAGDFVLSSWNNESYWLTNKYFEQMPISKEDLGGLLEKFFSDNF